MVKLKLIIILFVVASFAVIGCGKKDDKSGTDVKTPNTDTRNTTTTPVSPDSLKDKKDHTDVKSADTTNKKIDSKTTDTKSAGGHVMQIETTMGKIKVQLFPDKAPKTVEHIEALVNKGFYNGIIFHRVINGFMIQGGDPSGTGTSGSGQTIPDEFANGLKHEKGVIAMANTGRPNSQDSQFYITLAPQPSLDGKYTVFGKVIEGMDVVEKIGQTKTDSRDKPVTEVKMTKVTMVK
jgi:cyclophilin family peptidyl-prolyl cis-trans isomerase